MADVAVGGPLAIDLFGIGGIWIIQSSTNDDADQDAIALGANGDEIADQLYDGKNSISCVYKNVTVGGVMTYPSVGEVLSGYHVDSVAIALADNEFPMMTVTGHTHDSNVHVDTTMNEYVMPDFQIVNGFGVSDKFSGGSTSLRQSVSINLSATHDDQLDGDGQHGAGENHNGQCTVECNYLGTPSTPSRLTTLGFIQQSANVGNSNENRNSKTLSFRKGIAQS